MERRIRKRLRSIQHEDPEFASLLHKHARSGKPIDSALRTMMLDPAAGWSSRMLKKAFGDRLPNGRGSANTCKHAVAILSRAREQAVYRLYQQPARRGVAAKVLSLAEQSGSVQTLVDLFFIHTDKIELWETALTIEQVGDRAAVPAAC